MQHIVLDKENVVCVKIIDAGCMKCLLPLNLKKKKNPASLNVVTLLLTLDLPYTCTSGRARYQQGQRLCRRRAPPVRTRNLRRRRREKVAKDAI